eukprot:TRINITY_DN9318_c0_g1_i1.p1 TRINITY_DN9318_c0_g1~~TRINITY_DN9318_c0_g1_i1.p1  ORF type:complete len:109 (-),score=15.68 TRINITY_DN9318_c0_g1_i1:37-330(-)
MDPTQDLMSKSTKISVSKKMFIMGFFGLPWLWLVNFILFRHFAKKESTPGEVKLYVYASLGLSLLGFVGVVVWYVVFSVGRPMGMWEDLVVTLPSLV